MNSEAFAIRKPDEELAIKNEDSEELVSNRIKIEHSDWDENIKLFEQVLINKTENDQNLGALSGMSSNSIKNEPDEGDLDKWDIDNKNSFEAKVENSQPEMEMDSESKEGIIKNEYDGNVDATSGIVLSRIKNEYGQIDTWEHATSENKEFNIQQATVKPEADMDSEEFRVSEITEEFIIKSESETGMDAVSDLASDSMAISKFLRIQRQVASKQMDRKSFSCYNCNHTAHSKHHLISHLKAHSNKKYVHFSRSALGIHTCIQCNITFRSEIALDEHIKRVHSSDVASVSSKNFMSMHSEIAEKLSQCIHCNATFRNKILLDDHVVKKHPDFITSITAKIYECTDCIYKTTLKNNFDKHKTVHCKECTHCNMIFKTKTSLDNHVLKRHPNFVTSVTSKLYECTSCIYKTTFKNNFDRHKSVHSQTTFKCELSKCTHCNKKFKRKVAHDDHVVKRHPNFITSITSKLYECTDCIYKTTLKNNFDKHKRVHSKSTSKCELGKCLHCNMTFRRKIALDDHVAKRHPDFITSITSKLYECTCCIYKTTFKNNFDRHTSVHSQTTLKYELKKCMHCNKKFKRKIALDDHVAKRHPNFIASVNSKLYQCTSCIYKTTSKSNFDRHNLVHSKVTPKFEFHKCTHCNMTFKSKTSLDDHVLKSHPNFITSITSKLYECTCCIYKTTFKNNFDRHKSIHAKTTSKYELRKCMHCNMTFKSKIVLDNHVLKKHPNFTTLVTN